MKYLRHLSFRGTGELVVTSTDSFTFQFSTVAVMVLARLSLISSWELKWELENSPAYQVASIAHEPGKPVQLTLVDGQQFEVMEHQFARIIESSATKLPTMKFTHLDCKSCSGKKE